MAETNLEEKEITYYDLMNAQLEAGALLLKISEDISDPWKAYLGVINTNDKYQIVWTIHPKVANEFIDRCSDEGVPIILLDDYYKAEKEAFLKGHR